MIGQGPYSIWSDIIGCVMWAVIWFGFVGIMAAVVWFLVGVVVGVLI